MKVADSSHNMKICYKCLQEKRWNHGSWDPITKRFTCFECERVDTAQRL